MPPGPAPSAPAVRRRRSDGEQTRRKVIEATIECILQGGYYYASSNQIARSAGVTWGTIQHQFGSREALLLAVLHDSWNQLEEAVSHAEITGASLEDRLEEVLGLLSEHYGQPPHLAQLQILLDLTTNPTTSAETRRAALAHGKALSRAWRPLFARALGEAAEQAELTVYAFKLLRGYLTGELIASRISPSPRSKQERKLVVRGAAAAIREAAAAKGISVD